MDFPEFSSSFRQALAQNRLPDLSEQQIERFYQFATHLLTVNQTTNLTAIRTMPEVITKHFADSLLALPYLPTGASVLDLGCGAGFPSIPLCIARPDLHITALDSTAKKIEFVKSCVELLHLPNLKAVSGRAEDKALRQLLGFFDVVTSRAVARLNILCELCMPYTAVGGRLLALKASKADEELAEAKKAIVTLGGGEVIPHNVDLVLGAGSIEPRCIIEIKKTRPTPTAYPRAYAAILKKPL